VGVIPWSPLARGRLTRPWGTVTERSQTDKTGANFYTGASDGADGKVVAQVERLAQARGVPMASVGLAWLLARPGVTAPIVGVSKMQHLEDALGALDLALSAEDIAALEASYVPHPVSGHD
jgi:aryl-alcohol dehydrogenase-like predicted oxidoreductase